MMGNYSLSDVAAVTGGDKNNDMMGGGAFFWIFALLILAGGGGFGGFGGNKGAAEVSGYQLGELSGRVSTKDDTMMLQNNINQGFAGTERVITNAVTSSTFEIVNKLGALSTQVAQCCCDIKQSLCEGFGQVRYDLANFTAQTNANTTAQIQKVLDKLCEDKAQEQAQRISNLELQNALCGVVRYPNNLSYNAGCPPFSNNGCC